MATATLTRPRGVQLREAVAALAGTSRVDAEGYVIRGVKILGRESLNGREYSADALRGAVGLYENCRVYADHDRSGAERKVRDFVGRLVRVQLREGGLYGDLELMRSHPLAPLVLERAERFPDSFGLSHFAEGEVRREDGKMVVWKISRVRSCDLVADPASTNGLFESMDDKDPMGGPPRSSQQREIQGMLQDVQLAAARMVSDDSASVASGTRRRMQALSKAFKVAIRDILDAMSADGGRKSKADNVSTVPPARVTMESRDRDADAFEIPKDTKRFAQWLGSSGNRRTRKPVSESERRRKRFLNWIR